MIADGLSDQHEKESVISAADLLDARPGASCSAATTGPLLPCPFCGKTPLVDDDKDGICLVSCETEDCIGVEVTCPTLEDAREFWNRRDGLAQPTAVSPGVIERMVTDAWDDARKQAIEECAKAVEPKGPRPCDCERCYCGNHGDLEAVSAWDADAWAAKAIRALAAQPPAAPVERKMLDEFKEFLTDLADLNPDDATREALLAAREYIAEDNNPKSNRVLALIKAALDGEFPHERCSAGRETEPPEGQLAGRDCPGVLESDPALFNILNNALGTMHYHRLMSALNWNGYIITREPQASGE